MRGLGETFNQANAEQPYSEVGLTGIGYILSGLADDLEVARDLIEYGPKSPPEPTDDDEPTPKNVFPITTSDDQATE